MFAATKPLELAVCMDFTIEATYPERGEADFRVAIGGDREDFPKVGVIPGSRMVRIGLDRMADLGGGISVGIGFKDGEPGVTGTGARVLFKASRELWGIEREAAFVTRVLAARKAVPGGPAWLFRAGVPLHSPKG